MAALRADLADAPRIRPSTARLRRRRALERIDQTADQFCGFSEASPPSGRALARGERTASRI